MYVFNAPPFTNKPLNDPKQAENALEAEKQRVANYLNPAETEEKLLKVVIEELLEKQEATLLERCVLLFVYVCVCCGIYINLCIYGIGLSSSL